MKPITITVQRNQERLFDRFLSIIWDDSSESNIPLHKLRRYCPCATCMADWEAESDTYIPLFQPDQLTILSIQPVGTYALNISWKDGHNTGIFEFAYLRKLQKV